MPSVLEMAVMLTEERALRCGWVERPLTRADFAKLRIRGRAEVGRTVEVAGLPRDVPANLFLITWQRVHWRPEGQAAGSGGKLSIRRIPGPGRLQLTVPPDCAGWVLRALVAPLLSDGTLGHVGAVRAYPRAWEGVPAWAGIPACVGVSSATLESAACGTRGC